MISLALAGVAALLLVTGTAHAFQCAVVLKTYDGFLALRERPDWRSKMITKLRRDDYLFLGCWGGGWCDNREWAHVERVPRIDDLKDEENQHVPEDNTFGWVRRKYIQEFTCPKREEDQAVKEPEPATQYPSWLGIEEPPAEYVYTPGGFGPPPPGGYGPGLPGNPPSWGIK